ncbi:TetR/AcrR family transcriptional regulator [Aerococcus sp. L_32]|uniref:TetR/AcrR family transcriptional regulator n=1 Tax=Aerococcus sp. L_32 TaxID=3422316 RepID=UPI003D6B6D3A
MNNLEKNTYVKKQITTTLLNLLNDFELSEISISTLTEKSQVSRNSFYRNFSGKEDVIKQHLVHLLSKWDKEWKNKNSHSNAELFGHLFSYLKENSDLILLIHKKGLFYLFRESYFSLFGNTENLDNISAYTVSFISNGVLGWIEEWINRGMQESAETMTELLLKTKMK